MNAKTIYIKIFKIPQESVNSSKQYDSYLHSTYTLNNTLVKCPIASSCIGMTWQFHYVYILRGHAQTTWMVFWTFFDPPSFLVDSIT